MKERIEKPINESLLWTDLYKLTMGQIAFLEFPEVYVRYEFVNRGKTKFPPNFAHRLKDQIQMMADLSLKEDDNNYLKDKCPYLTEEYRDWFGKYSFNPEEVEIEQKDGDLNVNIEGPWARTIYWEVPLMATISELYYQMTDGVPDDQHRERAKAKGAALYEAGVKLLEFGTRRAFSSRVHRETLEALIETARPISEGGVLLGTSNVALAKEFSLNPSGTYAHELVMAMGALFGVLEANEKAMEVWTKQYLGLYGGEVYPKLGTALTDTYTTGVFLRSFNKFWAKYFTNLRQDSGDPFEIGEKIISRLQQIGVDPKEKGIVFSDGLNIPKAILINEHFKDRVNPLFGIGTDLTNDVGVIPLNMVIKLFGVRRREESWLPTIKISDNPDKISGDQKTLKQVLQNLDIAQLKAA